MGDADGEDVGAADGLLLGAEVGLSVSHVTVTVTKPIESLFVKPP